MKKLENTFRDELNYLLLLGKDEVKRNPQLAPFLDDPLSHPDTARLIECFALLNTRLRLRIEDHFPEVTQPLLNLLEPNYLRPWPSVTMTQFMPQPGEFDRAQTVPGHTGLDSDALPVEDGADGVTCQFRTAHDMTVHPLKIVTVEATRSRVKSTVSITLKTLNGEPVRTTGCDTLDFYLGGEPRTALTLYLWLFCHLEKIAVIVDGDTRQLIPSKNIHKPGFSPDEALLPSDQNLPDSYRILQEYLAYPQRFCAFRLTDLMQQGWGLQTTGDEARIEFHFSRALPDDIQIGQQDFSLHCVPAINVFQRRAKTIGFDGASGEYALEPRNNKQGHYEIFAIERVTSRKNNTESDEPDENTEHTILPYEPSLHAVERHQNRHQRYYKIKQEISVVDDSTRHTITFVHADETPYSGNDETVAIDLLCTNGHLPSRLAIGDITRHTQKTPAFVTFTNCTQPTRSYPAVADGERHWAWISNLSPNYLTLGSVEAIREVLRIYNTLAAYDIQIERQSEKRLAAIQSIKTKPVDRLIAGVMTRGLESQLAIDPEGFLCEGEMHLFATVLSEFFSLYSSVNSFHHLVTRNTKSNEIHEWPLIRGKQPLL